MSRASAVVAGTAAARPALIALCLLSIATRAPRVATATTTDELAEWLAGPVQWLILPDERKELKRLDSSAEVARFIDRFWRRRDRDPANGDNEYRNTFFERVRAADILYEDEGERGSLTDRGRALILMGAPAHVTVTTEPVMAWDPASRQGGRVTMRNVDVEIWGYRMEDLPPGMTELLLSRRRKSNEDSLALTLTFRQVGRRTELVEGDELLEVAARAAVVPAADP